MEQEHFVQVTNATKIYHSGGTQVRAISDLTFFVQEGEFAVVLGPSGAGKTTVLNLLGGMDTLTSGEITVGGKRLSGLNARRLGQYRRHDVGFVFQFYNLMPNLTALENIELATEICKDALPPLQILERVELLDRAKSFPSQLSGGEQQRVSIARAVAKNPKILLCDEPTGALDYLTGKRVLRLLHDMCRQSGKTVIVVTHNAALRDMADRVIVMRSGAVHSMTVNPNPAPIEEIEW